MHQAVFQSQDFAILLIGNSHKYIARDQYYYAVIHIRKLRLRAVKYHAQSHPADMFSSLWT